MESDQGLQVITLKELFEGWRNVKDQIQKERELAIQIHILQNQTLRKQSIRIWKQKYRHLKLQKLFYLKIVYINYKYVIKKYFHLLKDIKYQRIRQNAITQIINQKIDEKSQKILESVFKSWKVNFQIAKNGKKFQFQRQQAQLKHLLQLWRSKLQTRQKQKNLLYKILVSKKDNLIKYAIQQWRKNQSYNKIAQKECQILNWFSEQQQKQKLVPIRLENSSTTSTSFMPTTQRNGNFQQFQTQRPPLYSDKKHSFANNNDQATHRSIKSIDISSVQMHGANSNKINNLQANSFNNDYIQRETNNGDLLERDYNQYHFIQQQQQLQLYMNNSFSNNNSNPKPQEIQVQKIQNYQSFRRNDNGKSESSSKNLEIIRENQQPEVSYQQQQQQQQQSERKQNDELLMLQENKNQLSKQYKIQELRVKIQNYNLELQEKIQEYNDLKALQLENDKDLVAYMKILKEDIKTLVENSKELKQQLINLQ
ncbi:hypothetical protein ABPG72_022331 [Tetrahymena utriculariae]